MRKVAVIGSSAAGKTTLAAELARRLGVVHIELDALHHGPNWTAAPPAEFRARVRSAMDSAPDGWVIDGNYQSKLGDLVTDAADTVIWLDLPLNVVLWRLWVRTSDRIRRRVELWNGNRESWRGAFWGRESLFVWTLRSFARRRREWPRRFAASETRVTRLRSPSEVQGWLDRLKIGP